VNVKRGRRRRGGGWRRRRMTMATATEKKTRERLEFRIERETNDRRRSLRASIQ
jgi:hypothetical protein